MRPLTREELENKITDLEKKLTNAAKKIAANGAGSVVITGTGAGAGAGAGAGNVRSGATVVTVTGAGGRSVAGGGRGGNVKDDGSVSVALPAGLQGGSNNNAAASELDISALARMTEELQALQVAVETRDAVVEQQKEEISRLRARNAELCAEEMKAQLQYEVSE
jgi:hypothetical protein